MAEVTAELLEQLKAAGLNIAPQAQPQASGLTWAQPTAAVNVSGWEQVLVPIDVTTAKGNCTVYLSFNGVQTPEAVGNLVKTLIDKGFPLRAYPPKGNNAFSAK